MIDNKDKPYILCAAIWYDDKKEYVHQPKNTKSGYVLCGWRHHNIINIHFQLTGKKTLNNYDTIQGFLTSDNYFVNRLGAIDIAIESGQISVEHSGELFSEDLW